MPEASMEVRKARWVAATKVLCLLVLGLVVAPFIFTAIQGILGLWVAIAIVLGVNFFVPVIADAVGNLRLSLIKALAARNPIETLQRDYEEKEVQLGQFLAAVNKFAAATMAFQGKLASFKRKFPADADTFDENLSKMQKLLKLREAKYSEAKAGLEQYANEIERAKAIWDMGQEAAKMNKAAGMTNGDFLARVKKETALDSVSQSMNEAFADLETSLLEQQGETEALKLTQGVSTPLAKEKSEDGQPVRAGRRS